MSKKAKSKVVYICSDVRSGSTLIDMILSQHPEITSIGEGHHLHDYFNDINFSKIQDGLCCTCGKNIHQCEFWQKISSEYEKRYNYSLKSVNSKYFRFESKYRQSVMHLSNIILPKFLLRILSSKFEYYRKAKEITQFRFRLYSIIQDLTDCKYVVDSSKWPEAVKFYRTWFNKKTLFIFIERDLRAVSSSKHNRLKELNIKRAFQSSLRTKMLISFYKFFLNHECCFSLDYEKFTTQPEIEMKNIGEFLGLDDFDFKLIDKKNFNEKHNLGGSPHRFSNEIRIKKDSRWKKDSQVMPFLKKYWLYKLFYK